MILSDSNLSFYERVISSPMQALLITGDDGAGKRFVAKNIAKNVLEAGTESLENHPYYLHIEPTKNTTSIGDVRSITTHLQLKTIGKSPIRRVVLIIDAHTMTKEAQNALLKTLEEPPSDTMIILTTHNHTALLPTIRSRVTEFAISSLSYDHAIKLAGKEGVNLRSLYALSEGNAGTLHALLHETDHPQTAAIAVAKRIIASDTLTRLADLHAITSKKNEMNVVLAIITIAKVGRDGASLKNQNPTANRWNTILKHAITAHKQLLDNTQAKLVLTNLFINM